MTRVFRVTTSKNEVWEGVSAGFSAAEAIAMRVFLCPRRSIKRIEVVRIVD